MKHAKADKPKTSLNSIVVVVMFLGLISLFLIEVNFALTIPILSYLGWTLVCLVAYSVANNLKPKDSSDFDFYKVTEPAAAQAPRKKLNSEERIAISIDQDGLDPMVLFNEEKTGVVTLLKLLALPLTNKFTNHFSRFGIKSRQLGHPIESQTLLAISFRDEKAYCRLTTNDEDQTVEFAFPENSTVLYDQSVLAIQRLIEENSQLVVSKINVVNYQAMLKFYNYVKRLNAPENRSIEYISYYQGTLKICNSSYVALYDCTLQSTLTSWINKDGLIRTDNVDVDLEDKNMLYLMDIDMPYPECRLVNIEIVKVENPEVSVKLYLSIAEVIEGELTDNRSGLTLLMRDTSISIKEDEQFDVDLISVEQYFEQKSYPKF